MIAKVIPMHIYDCPACSGKMRFEERNTKDRGAVWAWFCPRCQCWWAECLCQDPVCAHGKAW